MALYGIGGVEPRLGEGAWAAPSAELIGDVRLGSRASVWFGAVLRGDNTPLILGENTNFQDGAVIESQCIVGAGALITEGKRFEAGSLIVGTPARVVRLVTEEEKHLLRESARHYAEKAQRYAAGLRQVEARSG